MDKGIEVTFYDHFMAFYVNHPGTIFTIGTIIIIMIAIFFLYSELSRVILKWQNNHLKKRYAGLRRIAREMATIIDKKDDRLEELEVLVHRIKEEHPGLIELVR